MNVLTIIDTLSVGGLGNVALSAAKALVDSGHSSFVLILYNDVDVVIPNGVNIIPMKLERKKSISKYHLQVKSLIDSIKFDNLKGVDLILVHGMHAIKILKECNYENAYFYIHNTLSIDMTKNYSFLKGLMKKIKIKNLYSGLNLIAVSEGVKNDALENIKIKPKSIRVIYNIIDIDTLRKKSLDVNPYQEDRYIVNISRFVPEKRHDLLIEAYMRSRIDCKLILIGDGIMRKKIEGLVQSNNLSDRVVLVGGG
jgi:glycosyltransferase involved in cell wall biosynthesis